MGNLKAALRELHEIPDNAMADKVRECVIDAFRAYDGTTTFKDTDFQVAPPEFKVDDWVIVPWLNKQSRLRRITDIEEKYYTFDSGHTGPIDNYGLHLRHATPKEVFREGAQVKYRKHSSDGSILATGKIIQTFLNATISSLDMIVPAHTGSNIIHAAIRDCELVKAAPQEKKDEN